MTSLVPKRDWRKHNLRLGFRCRCERCLTHVGPGRIDQSLGRFWQAGYGESNKDFRARVLAFHEEQR